MQENAFHTASQIQYSLLSQEQTRKKQTGPWFLHENNDHVLLTSPIPFSYHNFTSKSNSPPWPYPSCLFYFSL